MQWLACCVESKMRLNGRFIRHAKACATGSDKVHSSCWLLLRPTLRPACQSVSASSRGQCTDRCDHRGRHRPVACNRRVIEAAPFDLLEVAPIEVLRAICRVVEALRESGRPLFIEFSLRLSRDCLGKLLCFIRSLVSSDLRRNKEGGSHLDHALNLCRVACPRRAAEQEPRLRPRRP
jgi:hypothetical protein